MAGEKFIDKIYTDTIDEKTADAGVAVEQVVHKDGSTTQVISRVTSHQELTELSSAPATPDAGKRVIYAKDDGKVYQKGSDGIESPVGSGGAVDLVSQTAHGFVAADVGRPLYLNGSTYSFADADLDSTAEVVGLLSRRIDADKFEVTTAGEVAGIVAAVFESGSLPAMGAPLWLSTVAGKLHTAAPTTLGQIDKPMGYVSRSGGGTCDVYFVNMRGVVVGSSNVETTIDLGNNTTTNVLDVSDRDSGTIEGTVYVNATTPLRARFRLPFVKNGAGVYQLSPDQAGTDSVATFAMTSAGVLQCTLASHPGFVSARFTYGMNAAQIGATFPLSLGEGKLVPDGGAVGQFETITASKTLTLSSPRLGYVNAPSAAVLVDLPTAGIKAGYRYRLEVSGATETNYVALRSSSGAEVDRIGGAGFIEVVALQDAPTTAAHWRVVDVYEKQSLSINIVSGAGAGANYGAAKSATVVRRNKLCTFQMVGAFYVTTGTSPSDTFVTNADIPARFRPSVESRSHGVAIENGTAVLTKHGMFIILPSGVMNIVSTPVAWVASTPILGLNAHNLSYGIN